MNSRRLVIAAGIAFIAGAIAFVAVFSYLASNFDYPKVLDGAAAEVLPRLRTGGDAMRAIWALYAVLPLLLVVGAVGSVFALPSSPGRAGLGAVFATIGSFAMCLGLMRWPSVHWALAGAWESAGPDARQALAAVFTGLNLYLGNYVGEFLGEAGLGVYFLLSGLAMRTEARFPPWLGATGAVFAVLFVVGAFRNVLPQVQPLADINNVLLPLWLIVLGVAMIRYTRPAA